VVGIGTYGWEGGNWKGGSKGEEAFFGLILDVHLVEEWIDCEKGGSRVRRKAVTGGGGREGGKKARR